MTQQKNVAPLALEQWIDAVDPIKHGGIVLAGAFSVVSVEEDGSDIERMQAAFKQRKLWALLTDPEDGNDSQYLVLYGHDLPVCLKGCLVEGYVYANNALNAEPDVYPLVPVDCGLEDALYSCVTMDGNYSCVRERSAEAAMAYFENEFDQDESSLEINVIKPSLACLARSSEMSNYFQTNFQNS